METVGRIIVGTASIIYIILVLMKIDIPSNVFRVLLGIVLISQAIDEWQRYKKTKKKVYLLIPTILLSMLIFVSLYLLV